MLRHVVVIVTDVLYLLFARYSAALTSAVTHDCIKL